MKYLDILKRESLTIDLTKLDKEKTETLRKLLDSLVDEDNTKRLYAYRCNGNIIFNTQDYCMVDSEGYKHEREPMFDIIYKQPESDKDGGR